MSTKLITIEGFEQLSKQQLFDMSLAHIRSTRKKSMQGSKCVYSGHGCAAAPFIRPEFRAYADRRQGTTWEQLREGCLVPSHQYEFVRSLQLCHDNSPRDDNFMNEFNRGMERIASLNGLIYTPEKKS
jgi:hypothetical protein